MSNDDQTDPLADAIADELADEEWDADSLDERPAVIPNRPVLPGTGRGDF